MHLKCYQNDSIVLFGRFKGYSIDQIIDIDPTYIVWCINHLDHFYVEESVFDQISENRPTFVLSETTRATLNAKEKHWESQSYRDIDYNDRPSYGQYAGSYAQEYEGLSDDFINDVLDGCPDAYWNID
jgi:hypothetical protein